MIATTLIAVAAGVAWVAQAARRVGKAQGGALDATASHIAAARVSIPDREALARTLAEIRSMPEAIGRSAHENERYL